MSTCDSISHLMSDWVPLVRLCAMTNSMRVLDFWSILYSERLVCATASFNDIRNSTFSSSTRVIDKKNEKKRNENEYAQIRPSVEISCLICTAWNCHHIFVWRGEDGRGGLIVSSRFSMLYQRMVELNVGRYLTQYSLIIRYVEARISQWISWF